MSNPRYKTLKPFEDIHNWFLLHSDKKWVLLQIRIISSQFDTAFKLPVDQTTWI